MTTASIALVRLVIARRVLDEHSARAACLVLEEQLARLAELGEARAAAKALGLTSRAGTRWWSGDFDGAEPVLRAALAASSGPGCEYSRLTVLGKLAMWEYHHGRLRQAARLGRQALQLAVGSGLSVRHQTGGGHLALSLVALEWNDRAGAWRHLDDAGRSAEAANDPSLRASVSLLRAFQLSLDGRRTEAIATVADSRASAERFALPAWFMSRIAVTEAAVRLRCGDPEGALVALKRAPAGSDDWDLSRAAIAYAMGDPTTARALVDPVVSGEARAAHGGVVDALLLSARMYLDSGDTPRARLAVLDALRRARPEGRRRPFVEAGSWLSPLVTNDPELRSAAGWVGGGLTDVRTGAHPASDVATVLVEPLTEREREILSRMAGARSTSDIAADLRISVNMVKTHQRNVCRKLSVGRADEAVRRGRELRII